MNVTIADSIWDEWFRSYRDLCLIQAVGFGLVGVVVLLLRLYCGVVMGLLCYEVSETAVEMVRNRTGLMKYRLGRHSRYCLCVYGE